MEFLIFYTVFSYLFILGVLEYNISIGFKATWFTYAFAPITLPILLGKYFVKKNNLK